MDELSIPVSPKVNSAPTTPIDFHQNTAQSSSWQSPRPANSLPIDIRKNRFCIYQNADVEAAANLRQAQSLMDQDKCFLDEAVHFDNDEITSCIDKLTDLTSEENMKLFICGAEANLRMNDYNKVVADCQRARNLNPNCCELYYLEGQAQHRLSRHAEALAVFSQGLARDPTNDQLFEAMMAVALSSEEFNDFESDYNSIKLLGYENRRAVITTILGQMLLTKGYYKQANDMLESALEMGLNNEKFRASVLSTLGHLNCIFKNYHKALSLMEKELNIHSQLGNSIGQCRVLNNLGRVYYKLNLLDKSLESHKKQKDLGFTAKHLLDHVTIATNALGHLNLARNDFVSALNYHQWCLNLAKEHDSNEFNQFKELLNIGHVHLMTGNLKSAEDKYKDALELLQNSASKLKQLKVQIGKIMVEFNFAYLHLRKNSYIESERYYSSIINIAKQMGNDGVVYEMRASMGLGHTYRLMRKYDEAKECFEKQVKFAEKLGDISSKSHGLCSVGMILLHTQNYSQALKYFKTNLELVSQDQLLESHGLSYMGSVYYLLGEYNKAKSYYESSRERFEAQEYCSTERKSLESNLLSIKDKLNRIDMNASQIVAN